ncbi:hypothetical protein [Sagittula salina]|uniref:Uncharacterized protein n=1 Tax=Sagittula salina TaxID=2820268 RepID=A0A940MJ25_9RHOB|nr:hypothetical protein [Sagittula salina]MBP0482411.1 hypothetical protein [Sagittula salina]
MLRIFLAPIFETGESWQQIAGTLRAKGYALSFREGHLVVLDDRDRALCTGSDLGVPMAAISARIGRPCVVARADGHAGDLRPV